MNPFGTTRQDVGGENYRYEPRRPKWYDVVPFRPCHPPIPLWIIDWPLETAREQASLIRGFVPCAGPDGTLLGLPSGTAIPPGPLEANPTVPIAGVNAGPVRVWYGRTRGAGTDTRCLAASPLYSGPAIISWAIGQSGFAAGGGAVLRDTYGIGVSPVQVASVVNQPKTAASVNPPGFTIYDASVASDQINEQLPQSPANAQDFRAAGGNQMNLLPTSALVTYPQFCVWLMMECHSVNASSIEVIVQVRQIDQASADAIQGGRTASAFALPFNQASSYIGLPGVVG